uniref:EF-hand domain-containing protein n=1 Tax=Salix viminalis TaxID=40686 RepID=A0A6N2MIS5_SALVM
MGFDMVILPRKKGPSKVEMTMEEFKKWVLRYLDADQDGKITKDELAEAVGRRGEWFAGLKAWKGMRSADSNRNLYIEILTCKFAQSTRLCRNTLRVGFDEILLLDKDMGIHKRLIKGPSKDAMTMEEFKKWVLRDLDADQDGKITKDELAEAVRRSGEWFAGWKARKGMRSADSNRNGIVDDIEITNLAEFAQKHLGIMIIP